jgi:hypothetical protein
MFYKTSSGKIKLKKKTVGFFFLTLGVRASLRAPRLISEPIEHPASLGGR